jgi:hypothetical protein
VLHQTHTLDVEEVRGQDQRAQGVVGDAGPGVTDDLGIARSRPSMASGSIRESMQVRTPSFLAAFPSTPESWNSFRYRSLAAMRSSNTWPF